MTASARATNQNIDAPPANFQAKPHLTEMRTPAQSEENTRALNEAMAELPHIEGSVGLGVDIVSIERIEQVLARTPRFETHAFSADERAYCRRSARPAAHFACRFAAKEAVLKALGTGFSQGISPDEIEVTRNAYGKPAVRLTGRAHEVADALGVIEIPLSLSFTHTDAVACALAITKASEKAKEERRDPWAELAQSFKEARSFLDELPSESPTNSKVGGHDVR